MVCNKKFYDKRASGEPGVLFFYRGDVRYRSMSTTKKCQAKGGPANCVNPQCPEKQFHFETPASFIKQAARPKPKTPGAWSNEGTVLFRTQTGSKLYGLDTADSDDDFYVITPSKYVARQSRKSARQSFAGDADTVYMDFRTFNHLATFEGAPTVLEVMFSRKSVSDYFEDYRQNFFCSDPVVLHKYMKTIKTFSLWKKEDKIFKMRRHALRVSTNLEEILYTGRFNPTLSPTVASRITRFAGLDDEKYLRELKAMCPIEVDWDEIFFKEAESRKQDLKK